MADKIMVLKRYTEVPALLYLLKRQSITLLDPATWDDKNDIAYMQAYKAEKQLSTLLAMCFTLRNETYHHWHVFAGGQSGVCIHFKTDELLDFLSGINGIRHGLVMYPFERDIAGTKVQTDKLPFTKKYGYRDEKEYRVIYESESETKPSFDIEIPLSYIRQIQVNPWIHGELFNTLKETIRSTPGCKNIRISKSSLITSRKWQTAASTQA